MLKMTKLARLIGRARARFLFGKNRVIKMLLSLAVMISTVITSSALVKADFNTWIVVGDLASKKIKVYDPVVYNWDGSAALGAEIIPFIV